MTDALNVAATLLTVAILSLGAPLLIMVIKVKLLEKKQKPQKPTTETKIYYITEKQYKPKRKKRAKKKPDIALSGVVLTPEQFEKVRAEKELEKT